MKILFVGLQYIHTARWIHQLKNTEHEIYLFDCLDRPIHEALLWTHYTTNWSQRKRPYIKGEYFLEKKLPKLYQKIAPYLKVTASEQLAILIKEIQPDLVHSLEMQSQTYPLLKVRKKLHFNWAYSCWGNDIYYYIDVKKHKRIIRDCLDKIDYFFLECARDKKLIRNITHTGKILGIGFPGGGGYELNDYQKDIQPVSERNLIIIKGYEHQFGRALKVLEALEQLVNDIKTYDIYVYSAHHSVIDKIKEMNTKHQLDIQYSARNQQITHQELLQKFGKAKIAIGNNISDGIPNTLLEAMILGAFPIQSNPGGATEDYLIAGENGFLINNPTDSKEIAVKIKRALQNDDLLEKAFLKNQEMTKKLAYTVIQEKVIAAYQKIEEAL